MTAAPIRVSPAGRLLTAALTLGLTLTLPPGKASATERPPHDDVATAVPVSSLPTTSEADLAAATTEEGEPVDACVTIGHTVWYTLTVARDTAVQVDTGGTEGDTAFVVWDNTAWQDPVVCAADDGEMMQARASFVARAGVSYLIQIGAELERGIEPSLLRVTFREAPKATGKPQLYGQRDAGLAAVAFYSAESRNGAFHTTRVTLSDRNRRTFGSARESFVDVQLDSWRLTVDESGRRVADEWFGFAAPEQYMLRDGLQNASAGVTLVLERHRCVTEPGTVSEPECAWLPSEHVQLQMSWTGDGQAQRDLLSLADRGLNFHVNGTAHLTWRAATAAGTVAGDTELKLGNAASAVLVRDAIVGTSWSRA